MHNRKTRVANFQNITKQNIYLNKISSAVFKILIFYIKFIENVATMHTVRVLSTPGRNTFYIYI